MLLRFAVTNHLSIRETAEVSFVATSLKERSDSLISCRYAKHGVLPVVALYGANASGKSNVLSALVWLRSHVLMSFNTSDEEGIPYHPFALDEESSARPSTFELDFVLEGTRYQFGLQINGERVLQEWLYSFPKSFQQVLYFREKDDYHFGRSLTGSNRLIQSITRKNSLFLSAAVKSSHPVLGKIGEFFRKSVRVTIGDHRMSEGMIAKRLDESASLRDAVSKYLSIADTGITDVQIENISIPEEERKSFADLFKAVRGVADLPPDLNPPDTRKLLKLGHHSSDGVVRYIDYDDESQGTVYLLSLLPAMIQTLELGGTLVLDEITTSLHTLLAQRLVALFGDKTINRNGAQLIFTTHDTNLLSPQLLRRDEIVFVEKSRGGESVVYPLSDIKTKNTDNIEKGYLQGRFGGIPYIEAA
jgi:AAA15 family ATPase/GTPase